MSKSPGIAASRHAGIVAWIVTFEEYLRSRRRGNISKFLEKCHKNVTPRIRDCFARARNDDPRNNARHACARGSSLVTTKVWCGQWLPYLRHFLEKHNGEKNAEKDEIKNKYLQVI
jgi:hypothetical protein